MKQVAIAIFLAVFTLIAGCNKAEKPTVANQVKPAATKPAEAASDAATPEPDVVTLVGTKLKRANDELVEIISVGKFDSDLNSLGGMIALEGRVAEVYPDKGAMVLVDFDHMKGCSDGCCPQAEVPVNMKLEDYDGKMPLAEAVVVVVGDLEVTGMGYKFLVYEIYQDDDILIHSIF